MRSIDDEAVWSEICELHLHYTSTSTRDFGKTQHIFPRTPHINQNLLHIMYCTYLTVRGIRERSTFLRHCHAAISVNWPNV